MAQLTFSRKDVVKVTFDGATRRADVISYVGGLLRVVYRDGEVDNIDLDNLEVDVTLLHG